METISYHLIKHKQYELAIIEDTICQRYIFNTIEAASQKPVFHINTKNNSAHKN